MRSFRDIGDMVAWFGGADLGILERLPEERNQFYVAGGAVLMVPTIAALGMSIRVESMTALSLATSMLIAGVLTFAILLILETTIVRTIKNPMIPAPVPGIFNANGVSPLDMTKTIQAGTTSNSWLIDTVRVLVSIAIGIVTSHAILEILYADDIEAIKTEELEEQRELLTTEFLYGIEAAEGVEERAGLLDTYPFLDGRTEQYLAEDFDVQSITGVEARRLLGEPSVIDDDTVSGLRDESERLQSEIAAINTRVVGFTEDIGRLNAAIEDEISDGQGQRLEGQGPVADALILERTKVQGLLDGEKDLLTETERELDDVQLEIAVAAEVPVSELQDSQETVQQALTALRERTAEIEQETEFDSETLGIGERTSLFFSVLTSNAGSLLIGVAFLVAFMGIDLTPYMLKRLFKRWHDTELILAANDRMVVMMRGHNAVVIEDALRRNYQMQVATGQLQGPFNGDPPQLASGVMAPTQVYPPPTQHAAPSRMAGSREAPTGFESEVIDGREWFVNRYMPIQSPEGRNSAVSIVEPADNPADEHYVLKEASPHSEGGYEMSLQALRDEANLYRNTINGSPSFPLMEETKDESVLILEYLERRSIDFYLFGRAGMKSYGSDICRHDVLAGEVAVWLRHLFRGLTVLWGGGYAMVDGHPSNTLITGSLTEAATFDVDPWEATPADSGYMKLVDPGSARQLDLPATVHARMPYMPAEYLSGPSRQGPPVITVEGDVYSTLGGVGYFLTTGRDPLYEQDGTLSSRGTLVPIYKLNRHVPKPLFEFVHSCLSIPPADRTSDGSDGYQNEDADLSEKITNVSTRIDDMLSNLRQAGEEDRVILQMGRSPKDYGIDV